MAKQRLKWLKNGLKSTYNVGGWFGMGYIKGGTQAIVGTFKGVFVGKKDRGETFDNFNQAIRYYGLTEDDLAVKLRGFKWQVRIYFTVFIIAVAYMIYLFFDKQIFPGIIMIPVAALALIKTALARFYYFQLYHRRLVRSLAEWWGGAAREKKDEK